MWFNLPNFKKFKEAYDDLFGKKPKPITFTKEEQELFDSRQDKMGATFDIIFNRTVDSTSTVSLADYQCPKCIMYAGGVGVMKVNENNNGFICNNCGYRQTYEQRRETNNK